MPVRLADISGNPYIGVFCKLVGRRMLAPLEASDQFVQLSEEALGVQVVRTLLGGTNLHGSLLASNKRGMIAPYFLDKEEIERALSSTEEDGNTMDIHIEISDDPLTAWGNNLLMGDSKAVANPDMSKPTLKRISDLFDIEIITMPIAGIKTVGSVSVMNSKGLLVHPKTSQDDIDGLKDIFGREVDISTANFGSPYLGASIVTNDSGAIIGSKSSGVEINRIENTLDLIG
ncbi:MAG: translation initiation factor IF-6 [Candidatus Thermoplasmatota archaeon]|nr:translation initiation factor IF-6 [Candidatus Thermoplasmatota archaeon]